MSTRTFYTLCTWIGTEDQPEDADWRLNKAWHFRVENYFLGDQGAPRPDAYLDRPLVTVASHKDKRQDFPFVLTPPLIVSARVRKVIQEMAKADCDFIPVNVQHDGVIIDNSYSVLHPYTLLIVRI